MSDEAAAELTRYLLTPDRYRGKSPLQEEVNVQIRAMTRAIAAQIVGENPELADRIAAMTRLLVVQALTEDDFLNEQVVRAVSQKLGELAQVRRGEVVGDLEPD